MRALIVVRLSRLTDASTSPERQLETCQALCDQRGYEVVGLAEDLDVSAGATTPFDRPELGDWLANRFHEFDVLVFYRVDRLVRRLFDLADMISWSREHDVTLVSATENHFDLSQTFGDILALLVAKVAEMELQAMSDRARSAAQHNLKLGRYRGGLPPYGYLPSDASGEWRLVKDPDQVRIIHEVVSKVLDGKPLHAIAHDLTRREVLTPSAAFDVHMGREPKVVEWRGATLKPILKGQALLGYAMAKGMPIRNDDGSHVFRAEPILTPEVFARVGQELEARSLRGDPAPKSHTLLLRILHCGVCGRPAYRLVTGPGRKPRYRCKSGGLATRCGNRTINMAEVDDAVEAMVLGLLEDSERLERVWDAGSDNSVELAEVNAELDDVTGLVGSPAFRAGTPQRATLDARITALAARQEALAAEEVRPAGWEWTPTDELFSDWWAVQDVTAKNIWLRSMGIRVEFDREQRRIDFGDLTNILNEQLSGGTHAAAFERVGREMKQRGEVALHVFPDRVEIRGSGEVAVFSIASASRSMNAG